MLHRREDAGQRLSKAGVAGGMGFFRWPELREIGPTAVRDCTASPKALR